MISDNSRHRSAPKWLIDRLTYFIEQEGINVKEGDIVWVVVDVDRWGEDILHSIYSICAEYQWGLAISNPCFEVWLYMHLKDIAESKSKTCKQFKSEINTNIRGGYDIEKFIKLVQLAVFRSRTTDTIGPPIPMPNSTRVYIPVSQILEMF